MSEPKDRERGFTMVELIIGISLGTVVGLLAMFVLFNTLLTQTTVAGNTAALTRAQAVSAVLDPAIRTAVRFTRVSSTELKVCSDSAGTVWRDFKVVSDPQAAPGAAPNMLQVSSHNATGSTTGVLAREVNSLALTKTGQELRYVLTMGGTTSHRGVVIDRRVVQRNPDPASGSC
ncbi:type II secretion system protein [Nocardioides sp. Kera G14]|uniref:type II secretion system protein n=1 Tax=Nocardioides sp. Kera G14 TaxID=2884264 RepID=UPI001D113E4D|nr:type II secretion system protein [Nocardioides sp. Kera G14]UDY23069.1 type II secretion system GspH family protein [Nocardioides sp. Kera G14]